MILDDLIFRFYRGNSMQGTFSPGDYLLITPVLFANIQPGDVIVYLRTDKQGNAEELVHRVIARIETGLIVRGDNNRHYDSAPVQPNQIIGKVFGVKCGAQKRVVVGGALGLRYVKLRRGILQLDRFIRYVFRGTYYLLRSSQIVSRLWHPGIRQIRVLTDQGTLVKYCYGNQTVAQWWTEEKRFEVVKPFDLVIPQPHPEDPQ